MVFWAREEISRNTNRIAVATVVVAKIHCRTEHWSFDEGIAPTELTCSYDIETCKRTILKTSYEVFLIIQVALHILNTLTIEDFEVVGKLTICKFTTNRKSEVTTILHSVEWVGTTTSKVCDTFGIDIDSFHRCR